MDEWTNFFIMKLGCVNHKKAEACSISLVPDQLRKSKVEAYTPQVVSIGPLHKGKRTNLLYMEEIKWHCMLHLLNRSKLKPHDFFKELGKTMMNIDEVVRASYNVDQIEFNRYELAKIMVLDGCFLLELLLSGSSHLKKQINSNLNHNNDGDNNKDDNSPGAEVIKREKVLSDLTMLENQIPFVVLEMLFREIFPEHIGENDDIISSIYKEALSILGYKAPSSNLKAFHFVQLVHSFIDNENKQGTADDSVIVTGNEECENFSHQKLKLQRCATRLLAAGVTIKLLEANNYPSDMTTETRFDLKVTFSEQELKIPRLHITETTEAKWCNLIAWELNRTTLEKQRGVRKEDRINCQFICYARFWKSLICSVHDVKLLQDREVISVQEVKSDKGRKKIMSNEDLMNFFRAITEGVPEAEIHMVSRLGHEIQKLNSYLTSDRSTAKCRIVTETSIIVWHIFRCFLTWTWYKFRAAYHLLRRDHIPSGWKLIAVLAVAAGLALTATQTHYSIHS